MSIDDHTTGTTQAGGEVSEVGAYGVAKAEISNLHNRLARISQQASGLSRERDAERARADAAEAEVERLRIGIDGAQGNARRMRESLVAQRDTARAELERLTTGLRTVVMVWQHVIDMATDAPASETDIARAFVSDLQRLLDGADQ